MSMFIQLSVNGIAMGCIYGLVALGAAVIWSSVRALNFAQGDILMVGAYLGYTAMVLLDMPFWLSFVAMLISSIILGLVFQRVAYYPLRNKPFILVVVSTIGVSILLKNAAQNIWGNAPLSSPKLFKGMIEVAGIYIVPQHVFVIVMMLICMCLLYALLNLTKLGKMMRATANDQEAASLMGIKVDRMIAITFALSSCLAGIAGVLLGPIFYLEPYMGGMVTMRAFFATVIGGFGSIPGAVIGGIIVGLTQVLAAAYVSSMYKDVIVFGLCVLFLILRPQGIFGETVGEKA